MRGPMEFTTVEDILASILDKVQDESGLHLVEKDDEYMWFVTNGTTITCGIDTDPERVLATATIVRMWNDKKKAASHVEICNSGVKIDSKYYNIDDILTIVNSDKETAYIGPLYIK